MSAQLLKEISVNYSGGVDSTATAIKLLENFDRVHLHTYDHGYGQWFVKLSQRHVRDLKREFGEDRVRSRIISSKSLFEKIVLNTLRSDVKKYKSGFVWCMGCHTAFHTLTIIYNLKNGIPFASDGSSPEVDFAVMQMPSSLIDTADYYAKWGIQFSMPMYGLKTREQAKELLKKYRMSTGIPFRERNPGTQPLCVTGNFQHVLDTIFSIRPQYDPVQVHRFNMEKHQISMNYIQEYFKSRGLDANELRKELIAKQELLSASPKIDENQITQG